MLGVHLYQTEVCRSRKGSVVTIATSELSRWPKNCVNAASPSMHHPLNLYTLFSRYASGPIVADTGSLFLATFQYVC